jgi:CHAT domain-containing protein
VRPRLHWCPTGEFTFLPLHAAGIYDPDQVDCCSDYVVSSYTPTLSALLRAQRFAPIITTKKSRLTVIAAPKAHDSGLPALLSVEEEMTQVISIAELELARFAIMKGHIQRVATAVDAANSLKSSTFAHIACHGTQNNMDPLSSRFCLEDGDLTVSRIMELDLKDAFFAFLSACETAKGDAKQPDQTIHLAAAMLFVGFRSVVATMW